MFAGSLFDALAGVLKLALGLASKLWLSAEGGVALSGGAHL